MARMNAKLLLEAGPRFELKADLASCMKRGGARFYASQGWTGGGAYGHGGPRLLRWREH